MLMLIAAIIAVVVAAIAEFQSSGRDLAAWGVIALGLGHIITSLA